MSARIGVVLVGVLLAIYIVLVGQRAWQLLISAEPVGVIMGVALVVLPLIAVWALLRELWFGIRAEKLGRTLADAGQLPAEEVRLRPSGRAFQEDADALFPKYRADVEAAPEDWRAWYRLGLVYDGAGDRKRARAAIRTAIRFEAAQRRA